MTDCKYIKIYILKIANNLKQNFFMPINLLHPDFASYCIKTNSALLHLIIKSLTFFFQYGFYLRFEFINRKSNSIIITVRPSQTM
jgi:hypothetical protein